MLTMLFCLRCTSGHITRSSEVRSRGQLQHAALTRRSTKRVEDRRSNATPTPTPNRRSTLWSAQSCVCLQVWATQTIKNLWDVTPCGQVHISWDFGGIYCPHPQDRGVSQESNDYKTSTVSSSEKSGNFYQTTRRHFAEGSHSNEIQQSEDSFSRRNEMSLTPPMTFHLHVRFQYSFLISSLFQAQMGCQCLGSLQLTLPVSDHTKTGNTTKPDSHSFRRLFILAHPATASGDSRHRLHRTAFCVCVSLSWHAHSVCQTCRERHGTDRRCHI